MFGYIKPFKPELKIKDFDNYKAFYCSLCKTLDKQYGIFAKGLLSYDLTFVAVLKIALDGDEIHFSKGRCRANPLKKCRYCSEVVPAIEFCAALTVILSHYKLSDNLHDKSILHKILAFCFYPISALMMRKAKRLYPELDKIGKNMIKMQSECEKTPDCGFDQSAEPTAIAISKIAEMLTDDASEANILSQLGYHIGRWIYFCDAGDDLVKDIKSGDFNPAINKFNLTKDDLENSDSLKSAKEYINGLLNLSMAQVIDLYMELDLKSYRPILDNILVLGMAQSQQQIYLGS